MKIDTPATVVKGWAYQAKAWYSAARPKTFTCSIIPVLMGTLIAEVPFHSINWFIAGSALAFSLCIQIGTHYINDALDFEKGTDSPSKLNKKAISSGILTVRQMFTAGILMFALAFIVGIPMIFYGGPIFTVIVAASIACGYIYTGGPYPLSYYGVGDLFVLVFYGLIATGASAYLQQGFVGWKALLAGTQIGLFAMSLMSINNLRDLREDRKAHKLTLAVRLGLNFARWQITLQLLAPFILNIIWYVQGYTLVAALSSFNLPIAMNIIRGTWAYDPGKVYNRFMIETAFVHMMFGFLLTLGYILR